MNNNKYLIAAGLITILCSGLPTFAAEYNPIEFNSGAAYGSTQWQIDRANWNIINNNKYSTYQVQVETENRVNMDKYIQSQVDTERTNRVAVDNNLQSQIDNDRTNFNKQLTKETNERKAEDLRIKNSVEQNRQGLNDLKGKVKNNTTTINNVDNKVNTFNQSLNNTNARVQSNSQALNRLDKRVDGLQSQVNKLDNRLEQGLATVTALTSLHPNPRYKGKTQIAIGAGMYADNVAGAVGIFHWINDRVMLNAGASYGGDDSFAGNVGISIGL